MILIPFAAFSQSKDTICFTKDQAVRLANKLDSLDNMAQVLKNSNAYCDTLVSDLKKELQAIKEIEELRADNNNELESVIKAQNDIITGQESIIYNQDKKIKKQRKRFKIFGTSAGSIIVTLVVILLI